MTELAIDTLVIGGGQAGLAAGYHLRQAGLTYHIVERSGRIGDNWRRRYSSLTLFTPRIISVLPGMSLAGDQQGYPSRDEFAAYLEQYGKYWELPISTGSAVRSLTCTEGTFVAELTPGTVIRSRTVIIATGAFQNPYRPIISEGLDRTVRQFDGETLQADDIAPGSRVLVVGDGATGRDIAIALAGKNEVFLAIGKPRSLLPERFFNRSIWWYLKTSGLLAAPSGSLRGKLMRRKDPFPNRDRSLSSLEARGIHLLTRLVNTNGRSASFSDAASVEIETVVWAAGFRVDFSWINVAGALGSDGAALHSKGISPLPGLYYLGRPWQRNRASALVAGISDDAAFVVRHLRNSLRNQS